jgi:hypothetical protein
MRGRSSALAALAIIVAMVWLVPAAQPTGVLAAPTITFSGRGSSSTGFFPLDAGLLITRATHDGQRNFFVDLVKSTGETDFLVIETGVFNGQTADRVRETGSYLLSVQADGNWTVTLEQPRPTTAPIAPQSYAGRADGVSPFVMLFPGVITVRATHNGQRNFFVELIDLNGRTEEFVFIETGPFTGSKSFGITQGGVFLFDIDADGDWTVTVEQTTGGVTATPTNTSPPTATPTQTPTPTNTPRPQPNCSPRPRVQVSVASTAPDTLTATITATGANNYLMALRFGAATNARIIAAGQTGTGNFTSSIAGFPPAIGITVQRLQSGAPVHVPIVVVDGCGEWGTFVGAGIAVR